MPLHRHDFGGLVFLRVESLSVAGEDLDGSDDGGHPHGPRKHGAGVCIQLFAAKIHVADNSVPRATMQVARKCSLGPTLLMPKSMTPRKPASRKKAESTS